MAQYSGAVPTGGRRDGFGIHSIGEFVLAVPALKDAERFYGSFGLNVVAEGNHLALRAHGNPHRWGRIIEGPRKRLHHVSFHCYEEDVARFRSHLEAQRVPLVRPPDGFEADGLWFHDHDGLLLHLRAGVKTSPAAQSAIAAPVAGEGVRSAPYRRNAEKAAPRRLSHILRFTTNVDRAIDFYCRVLGMGLSDRSGDGIAFLHAIHGSDHHLMAFVKSGEPGLHHLSWVMPSVDSVGLGAMTMADSGYSKGWGVGRHVLGSNYFYYCRDPWGSYCEYSCGIDFIPAHTKWEPLDHPAEDSFYLWGPEVPEEFVVNTEAERH
jgi:catechol 2,3-dioxygenase-like lactoylglutathione lyase family enzyme